MMVLERDRDDDGDEGGRQRREGGEDEQGCGRKRVRVDDGDGSAASDAGHEEAAAKGQPRGRERDDDDDDDDWAVLQSSTSGGAQSDAGTTPTAAAMSEGARPCRQRGQCQVMALEGVGEGSTCVRSVRKSLKRWPWEAHWTNLTMSVLNILPQVANLTPS